MVNFIIDSKTRFAVWFFELEKYGQERPKWLEDGFRKAGLTRDFIKGAVNDQKNILNFKS